MTTALVCRSTSFKAYDLPTPSLYDPAHTLPMAPPLPMTPCPSPSREKTIDTRGYRGESGRNASDGGNGGNNGFNGKGGAGGKITVVSRDPLPGDTLLTDVAGA
jgi:hypothetical protein